MTQKEIIENLKNLTRHKSDAAFGQFLGVTKVTVHYIKKDKTTKLHKVLPMLDWLLSELSEYQLEEFLQEFKTASSD